LPSSKKVRIRWLRYSPQLREQVLRGKQVLPATAWQGLRRAPRVRRSKTRFLVEKSADGIDGLALAPALLKSFRSSRREAVAESESSLSRRRECAKGSY
jgi:hypothetical protein